VSVRAKGKIIAGLQERIAAFEPLPVPGIGRARWFVEMTRARSVEA